MKLLLLHGPAITESRKKLSEIKKGFQPENVIVLENPDQAQIKESLLSLPLLLEQQLYVFENPPKDFTFEFLAKADNTQDFSQTAVFWFDGQLEDKSEILKAVKDQKGQVIFFPAEKEINAFPFIDALGFKDKKAYLELDKLKKAGYDSQYLITMVYYLLRSLAVSNRKSPTFVQKKMIRQRQNFSDIPTLYKFVLETDFKIKNGLIDPDQAEFGIVTFFVS